jgi:hypothetical protein
VTKTEDVVASFGPCELCSGPCINPPCRDDRKLLVVALAPEIAFLLRHQVAPASSPHLGASRRDDLNRPLVLGTPPGADEHSRRNADPTRGVD